MSARVCKSTDSTPTKIALGYNSGGSVAVGAAQSVLDYQKTLISINNVNLVTGNPWLQSELNGLQLNMRSKA
jgi:hypothetical protein